MANKPYAMEVVANTKEASISESPAVEAQELPTIGTTNTREVVCSKCTSDGRTEDSKSTASNEERKIITERLPIASKEISLLELRYTELLLKRIAQLEAEAYKSLEGGTIDSKQEPNSLKHHKPKTDVTESVEDDNESCDTQESHIDDGLDGTATPVEGPRETSEEQTIAPSDAVGTIQSSDKAPSDKTEDQTESKVEKVGNQSIDKGRVRYCELRLDKYGQYSDHPVAKPYSANASEEAKSGEYAISWRLHNKDGVDAKPELLIESYVLREALKEVGAGNPSMTFDTKVVAMPWPYELIYHKEQRLRDLAAADSAKKEDIEILLREVEQRQAIERKDAEKLSQNGQVTYDLLWTLFYIGDLVIQKDIMGKEQVSVIGPHQSSARVDSEQYDLGLCSVDYDGTDFTYLDNDVTIEKFKGAKTITDLEVIPFKKWKGPDGSGPDVLRERLSIRGRTFEDLCNDQSEGSFRQYGGLVVDEGPEEMLPNIDDTTHGSVDNKRMTARLLESRTKDGVGKLEKGSLVIIDHEAYFDYAKKPLKLGSQSPWAEPCDCSLCVEVRNEVIDKLPRTSGNIKKRSKLTDMQRLLCPPRVFGFAIRTKVWVQLLVEYVEEINQKSKEEPFNKLELDAKSKEILKTLIVQHSKGMDLLDDIIPGKGDGLIVLLHGPPGVGETLTAESLAKLSGKPLFTVSMTDVGTSPEAVERNLLRVFELATHWKALLLFDEADIFLETRSLQDLRRNSLVSVLLRIFEYFRGILFLTSNRVKTFDEAFQSRINVAVRYRQLTEPQRKRIWEFWLDKAADNISDRDEFEDALGEGATCPSPS